MDLLRLYQFILLSVFILNTTDSLAQQSIADDSLRLEELHTINITEQFLPTETRKLVNTIKIIKPEVISQRGVSSLEELLANEPNIRINYDPILGGAISLNGMGGENLKILVDGVPIIGRSNGNINASQISLTNIKQIEILEGAQSVMYGSDASAGVINIVTKSSQPSALSLQSKMQLEYNGFQNIQLNIGKKLGKFLLQADGGVLSFDPYNTTVKRNQVWIPSHQRNGKLSAIYSSSEIFKIRLDADWMDNTVTNLDSVHRPLYKPYAFDDYYYTHRNNYAISIDYWLKKNLFLQAIFGYNQYRKIKESVRYDFDKDTSMVLGGDYQDTANNNANLIRVSLGGRELIKNFDFVIGADNYYETVLGKRVQDTLLNRQGFASNNEAGLFSNIQYKLFNSMTLSLGGRGIFNRLYGSAFTPSVSFAFKENAKWSIRGSYVQGFRSPALKELYFNFIDNNHHILGNLNLKPERSVNYKIEFNYLHPWRKSNIEFLLSGYYNSIRDQIELADISTSYSYINIARMKTKGIRAGFNVQSKQLQFSTYYNYAGYFNKLYETDVNLPEVTWAGDWTNNCVIRTPKGKYALNIWSKLTGPTPYYYIDENNTLVHSISKGWLSLNSSLQGKFFDQHVDLSIGAKNMLDRRTVDLQGDASGPHGVAKKYRDISWGRSFYIQAIFRLESEN